MTKTIDRFLKVLESYVYLKECAAISSERAELDFDLDIYDLEDYLQSLTNIADKYKIKIFKISDDYDVDELNEYIIYLENKLINDLRDQLSFMYLFDK